MSSTFCTIVLSSLPVKSNRTPNEVTFLPLRVVNFAKRSGVSVNMCSYAKRRSTHTSDRDVDGLVVLAEDRDVHVARQVPAVEIGGEVVVHVKRVLVDVQFVAEGEVSLSGTEYLNEDGLTHFPIAIRS